MKSLIVFVIGVLVGAYGYRAYERHSLEPSSPPPYPSSAAPAPQGSMADKLAQWHLSPDDIRADLDRTGEVVRSKAQVVGEKLSDARILAVIKSKYVLDRDLSALDIKVNVDQGSVLLTGTVQSTELIGRAVALALDTDGVAKVTARLAVR